MQPMMTPAPAAAAPMAPAPPAQAGPAQAQGYEICIQVKGDGTYVVSKEPLSEEEPGEEAIPGEGDMGGEGGEGSQAIDTFEGALKAAYGIYQENPEGGDGEDQMQQEFDGGQVAA